MKKISWWNTDIGDGHASLSATFQSKMLSYGNVGVSVEKEIQDLLGANNFSLCTSGSTSLLIALRSLNLSKNAEVIIPDVTFRATANAVLMVGAKPVIVKSDKLTGLIDLDSVKNSLNQNTAAVIPVHLNGKGVNISALREIVGSKVKIIEDCAQSFYCKSGEKYLGTEGDIGCFSFGVTKFMTCGQGGGLCTNDPTLFKEIRKYLFHGEAKEELLENVSFGFNFRQSDLLSSLLKTQLTNIAHRKQAYIDLYNWYKNILENNNFITLSEHGSNDCSFPIWIQVRTYYKEELLEHLNQNAIETYPLHMPLSKLEYLNEYCQNIDYDHSFSRESLVLPSGPNLPEQDKKRIRECLVSFKPAK